MMKRISDAFELSLGLFLWTLYYSIPVIGVLVFAYGVYDTIAK